MIMCVNICTLIYAYILVQIIAHYLHGVSMHIICMHKYVYITYIHTFMHTINWESFARLNLCGFLEKCEFFPMNLFALSINEYIL